MSAILVLASFDLDAIPVINWAAEFGRVWAVIGGNAVNSSSGARTHAQLERCTWTWVKNIANDGRTITTVAQWSRHVSFDAVVCLDEPGLQVAAQLREFLGVKIGQKSDSADIYRLKDVMAQAVAAAGLPVPAGRVAHSAVELLQAIRQHGPPTVVKPRDGMGSRGVKVIHSVRDAEQALRAMSWPSSVLVQEYVTGRVLHIDGFLRTDGLLLRPTVSAYGDPPLATLAANRPAVSTMFPAESALSHRAVEFVERVCAALPNPGGAPIHAELFHTEDDKLIFGEIASRTGGAGIPSAYRIATGANLFQLHTLAQIGAADSPEEYYSAATEYRPHGWYLEPPKNGTLLKIDDSCPIESVVEYRPFGQVGRDYSGPETAVECVQRMIVREQEGSTFSEQFAMIARWCSSSTIWSDV